MKRKTHFIAGIVIVSVSVFLSWALIDLLGDLSMLVGFAGAVAFVLLNPELMRGE